MALNYVQKGNHMTWTNNTEEDVVSGSPVVVGSIVGVALGLIPVGETGELATEEVWEFPKLAEEIAHGVALYFDGDMKITATVTATLAGFAFAAAASEDETVRVKINS